MKARILSIILLVACLGLVSPTPANGSRSSSGVGSPILETYPDQALVEDLSTYIPAHMQVAKVPGLSIALIQEGEIVWVEGFGKTNSITGKPVAGDTVFEVASISKVIAAYAALQLVEKGTLALDEPIHQYLSKPWLPASTYAEQITLRQLLTHTSGLTNNVNPVDKSIVYPPGERYEYSGVGFIYLQEVLEQVTGKSLEQIAQELVFEPLKMDASSYVIPSNLMARLAYGHINYGLFMLQLVVMLAVVLALILLVWLIIRRIRLGKFSLSARMLWISYLIAASLTLAFVIYFVGGEVNKWVTLTALWLIFFGAGMALLLFAGRKLLARLPGKWGQPKRRAALLALWSIVSALVLVVLTIAQSGPVPRLPAGSPNAAFSLRTTAPDLAKFLLELTSPQHLDPTLMVEMTSPQIQIDEDESWGLGIGIQQNSQGNLLWHDGNNADFHALMVIEQKQRNGVVVLTNSQNGGPLMNEIANYAMDKISGLARVQAVDSLLDVGGYQLHFRVYPGTEPAVLLESGGGADASYWNDLAPTLARETGAAVITYDRAGYGESDLPNTPYDIRQEVAALWRGLEQLGFTNSLILLGHSYGGMLIMVEACEHADAIRGLVFLDAMNVDFIDAIGGVQALINHPLSQHPFDRSDQKKLTKPQLAAMRVEDGLPGVVEYMRSLSIPQHIPVRVITAGIPWWPKPDENQAWRESHENLAASVKDGKLLVAERSTHLVPDEQPGIIVETVKELVQNARRW